ncbi:uncharacterized protein MYCFIDRAFT_214585 [Pseudocercospora fijiensis CIRAD86]|uniref:Uncharacterized protein n=1 Tax=Pseudocercospora fijiensis (strain CIRAD86) TaxID=383855 RepID=M2Z2F7_PSEFD|nr:uncharacterized protein MYCFIDRAFT_214585 [Pseudocercospora fijiensis CIRAD86]EME84025.1 hypothetical protein MYCFIDRAFT_214585 [Pseudocercospora fijiensis CIRAD86]
MVSWGTIQSLLLLVGPLLLPKAIAYYRSLKNRPPTQIKPLQKKTSYALTVLFTSGLLALISTFPLFAPENIFRLTESRLHTSAGVLLTRLASLRPLTPQDEELRTIFDQGGLEARLLYARYGPDVVLNCSLGKAGEMEAARNYLIYAIPKLLAPHLFHLFALGVATSGFLSGREGARWRTIAIIAGLGLAIGETLWIAYFDDTPNVRSVRVNDVNFIHWKMAVWRGLGIATTDGVLGWIIWLQATGRAFLSPTPAGERILDHAQRLQATLGKIQALGVVRNGTVRDATSRKRFEEYWMKEGEVMKDAMEQPEVLTAQRNALARSDAGKVSREAEAFVDGFLGAVPPPQSVVT